MEKVKFEVTILGYKGHIGEKHLGDLLGERLYGLIDLNYIVAEAIKIVKC